MKATEDSDITLEGLRIVERDGVYEEGEMHGENRTQDMDVADSSGIIPFISTATRIWQGKVRFRDGVICEGL